VDLNSLILLKSSLTKQFPQKKKIQNNDTKPLGFGTNPPSAHAVHYKQIPKTAAIKI
jgi:hypothetical protein